MEEYSSVISGVKVYSTLAFTSNSDICVRIKTRYVQKQLSRSRNVGMEIYSWSVTEIVWINLEVVDFVGGQKVMFLSWK
jgi:hypothetical protein